jgi:putative ABC transport system substrate-binding protein
MSELKRRQFIMVLGGATALPLLPVAVRAQQPAIPFVGFLGTSSPDADGLRAFHLGLKETGYVEGDNVTILHRWTEGRLDQLPEVAADLARRRVAVIASFGNAPALAVSPMLLARAEEVIE